MLEHIPGLPDFILFWMNDVSVIRVSRCGITHGTLSGKHVLTLVWMIMTDSSFKIVSNWAVLTTGLDLVRDAEEQVRIIRENLRIAQSRQKIYADRRRHELHLKVGDYVYLKVSPFYGTRRFQVRGKVAPRYVGPFRITKTVGAVAYQLELPQSLSAVHNVFHISQLKQCHRIPTDAIDLESLDLQPGLTYEEHPIAILDHVERKVKRSMVKFVKVQWSNHSEDEATWDREDRLRQEYPDFFSDE